MALLEVKRVTLAKPWREITGGGIDFPQIGFRCDQRAFDIEGWALGRESEAVGAEVWNEGAAIQRVRLNVVRKDLAAEYPGISGAERNGFRTTLSLFGARATNLVVHAVLRDHRRIPIGTIGVEVRWRQSPEGATAPLVSVIIPCFNDARFLREAIESVMAQTYPQVEIVVVDAGSEESASEVASRIPGVRAVRQAFAGRASAQNLGIRETSGDYLAFLDADSRLLPNAIEAGLAAFREHPECAFVAGHHRTIVPDGGAPATPETICRETDSYAAFLRHDFVGTNAAVLYRRDLFGSVGNFNEAFGECEDYDLSLRAARVFPFFCHHALVADSRLHESSVSSDPIRLLKAARTILRSQLPGVRRSARRRTALSEGVKFLRSRYGREVALLVRDSFRQRRWRRGLAGLKTILVHDPGSLRWFWN